MMTQEGKDGVVKEIPIPGIIRIPTYASDYLPVRRERNTYLRPKGVRGGLLRSGGLQGRRG